MADQQQFAGRDPLVRRYEYDDGVVLAADLGSVRDGTVDVVDGTAIVVVGDDQFEIDLPEGDARASIRNGVVTIEVGE